MTTFNSEWPAAEASVVRLKEHFLWGRPGWEANPNSALYDAWIFVQVTVPLSASVSLS